MKMCPDCGAPIPAHSPAGLCIPCLLKLAEGEPDGASLPKETSEPKLRSIGDYELIREIGRGGMGVVYEARQRSLDRRIALKLILAGEFASETAVARFKEEAEVIGHLDHANIVPIYEVGEQDGWHFYTMKLIQGESLAQQLQSFSVSRERSAGGDKRFETGSIPTPVYSPREAAGLLAKIARAVHFVHQHGIIHRDLSPENVLLDEENEPWVADFGLARLSPRGRLTRTYTIVGKPDYMAPEQADPRDVQLTTAADLFSFGVIFYELLSGQRPFEADSPFATLDRVRNENPIPPSKLNRAVDRDLDTICLKCLAKEPQGRYESAASFADDLERWLRDEPILARPIGGWERSLKWVRRHPLKAAVVLLSLLTISLPLVIAFYFYNFLLPSAARAHPIVGRDQNIQGFSISFETGRVDRATMNFDTHAFRNTPLLATLYFTNIPPQALAWISNLQCQVMADAIAVPDDPRGPVVRHGDTFVIAQRKRRDRAYYVAPLGWQGQDVLAWAPDARLCIILPNTP